MNYQNEIRNGTIGGTMLSILSSVAMDLAHTAIVAATGALVSFLSTLVIRLATERLFRKSQCSGREKKEEENKK